MKINSKKIGKNGYAIIALVVLVPFFWLLSKDKNNGKSNDNQYPKQHYGNRHHRARNLYHSGYAGLRHRKQALCRL